MPKITYIEKRFNRSSLPIIDTANTIISEYQVLGFFDLTLRQLYYQFVARDLLANTEQSYNRLGSIISDARRAGMIDWNAIVDRTRHLRTLPSWDKPIDILVSARDSYHRDLWATQPIRVEVWIEKDALVGVISSVCEKYDVPYFSCRGYVSDSEMWRGGLRMFKRFHNIKPNDNQPTTVFHLGDFDPSGLDMSRDIEDRLNMFSGYSANITFKRIALTVEQINELKPPPNPAKITDSRYDDYSYKWGNESWELDALDPVYIQKLVKNTILSVLNKRLWDIEVKRQEVERKRITDWLEGFE